MGVSASAVSRALKEAGFTRSTRYKGVSLEGFSVEALTGETLSGKALVSYRGTHIDPLMRDTYIDAYAKALTLKDYTCVRTGGVLVITKDTQTNE